MHSTMLSTFIKLPFAIKISGMSIFMWPFKTGFTAYLLSKLTINEQISRHQTEGINFKGAQ